jgi:hypothetical protein
MKGRAGLVTGSTAGLGKPALYLCESCTGGGYLGSDAYDFAALYEVLARQARESFKAKADGAK